MTAKYAFRDQPRTPVVLQDACGPVRMLIPALLKCAGDRRRANALIEQLSSGDVYGASTGLAILHAMQGDIEQAAEWANRGIAQRFLPLVHIVGPLLRPHAQWRGLARLMNLPG